MARALAFQADGKLVAAGVASPFAAGAFALIRYNADGSLDQSFGQSGTVVTDFGFLTVAFALAVQADGKLVSAGAGSVIGGRSHKFTMPMSRALMGPHLSPWEL